MSCGHAADSQRVDCGSIPDARTREIRRFFAWAGHGVSVTSPRCPREVGPHLVIFFHGRSRRNALGGPTHAQVPVHSQIRPHLPCVCSPAWAPTLHLTPSPSRRPTPPLPVCIYIPAPRQRHSHPSTHPPELHGSKQAGEEKARQEACERRLRARHSGLLVHPWRPRDRRRRPEAAAAACARRRRSSRGSAACGSGRGAGTRRRSGTRCGRRACGWAPSTRPSRRRGRTTPPRAGSAGPVPSPTTPPPRSRWRSRLQRRAAAGAPCCTRRRPRAPFCRSR